MASFPMLLVMFLRVNPIDSGVWCTGLVCPRGLLLSGQSCYTCHDVRKVVSSKVGFLFSDNTETKSVRSLLNFGLLTTSRASLYFSFFRK